MTGQISNNSPLRFFIGAPPNFEFVNEVIYITRGREILPDTKPIRMDDWKDVIARLSELEADEFHEQYNIDRGVEEFWQEVGRAKWIHAPSREAEYMHFCPAQIEYLHGGPFRAGKLRGKYRSINQKLGRDKTIEAWLELISKDPWLELDSASGEAGRANWLDNQGNVKAVFRFTPNSIWMYKSTPLREPNGHIRKRLDLCNKIAALLGAQVWDGLGEL